MQTGTIIMLCGLPGSGKTTLSKKLETERNAIRFCPDEWIAEFIEDQNNRQQMDKLRTPVENLQYTAAQRLTQLGTNVILENGFWSRAEREQYRDTIQKSGAKVELHFLKIPLEKLWKRLEVRNANLQTGTFAVGLEEHQDWYRAFEAPTTEEMQRYNSFKIYE